MKKIEKPISKRELNMGIKEEKEHTKSNKIAKKIAIDHLSEFPTYYTELTKMKKRLAKSKK